MTSADGRAARLDGFTVIGGRAIYALSTITVNGETVGQNFGGGVAVINASPVFAYDSIAASQSNQSGGMYLDKTNSVFTDIIISVNSTRGGVYISSGNSSFTRSGISENTCSGGGGHSRQVKGLNILYITGFLLF
jgi:hypothetical protein